MNEDLFKKYKKDFGANLKKIREAKYTALSEVDANTKFDSSNYHKYENGTGNPTLKTILELAASLKIHPKQLLDFEFDFKEE